MSNKNTDSSNDKKLILPSIFILLIGAVGAMYYNGSLDNTRYSIIEEYSLMEKCIETKSENINICACAIEKVQEELNNDKLLKNQKKFYSIFEEKINVCKNN